MVDEKRRVAFLSVLAAFALTAMKAIVGLVTGSLGVLSEAAHSGLDLGAALTTYYAVAQSSKPPDRAHLYGHGKVESLAGLTETGLLLATSFLIVYEGLRRLVGGEHLVDPSLLAFGVMFTSIILDLSRSQALSRAARKHRSQALEADALHFKSDIWSSSAVIVGLFFVRLGFPVGDSVAALGVAMIVVVSSLRLGRRTTDVLLDRAPEGLAERVEREVLKVEGVVECHRVRVRPTGGQIFIDMHIAVTDILPLDEAHEIASRVEEKVRGLILGADVVVHIEPASAWTEHLTRRIRNVASEIPKVKGVHDIQIHKIGSLLYVDLDLEVEGNLRLKEAHEAASLFERRVKEKIPDVADITTHLEAAKGRPVYGEDVTEASKGVVDEIRGVANQVPRVKNCHSIALRRAGEGYYVILHCDLDETLLLDEVHEVTSQIERVVKDKVGGVAHILVHAEPPRSEAF